MTLTPVQRRRRHGPLTAWLLAIASTIVGGCGQSEDAGNIEQHSPNSADNLPTSIRPEAAKRPATAQRTAEATIQRAEHTVRTEHASGIVMEVSTEASSKDLLRLTLPGQGTITVEGSRDAFGLPHQARSIRLAADEHPDVVGRVHFDSQGAPTRLALVGPGWEESIPLNAGAVRSGLEGHRRDSLGQENAVRASLASHTVSVPDSTRARLAPYRPQDQPRIVPASYVPEYAPVMQNQPQARYGVDTIGVRIEPIGCEGQVLTDESVVLVSVRVRPLSDNVVMSEIDWLSDAERVAWEEAQARISVPIDASSGGAVASGPAVYDASENAFFATLSVRWYDAKWLSQALLLQEDPCDSFKPNAMLWNLIYMASNVVEETICNVPPGQPTGASPQADAAFNAISLLLCFINKVAPGHDDQLAIEYYGCQLFQAAFLQQIIQAAKYDLHMRAQDRRPDGYVVDAFVTLRDDCNTGGRKSTRASVKTEEPIGSMAVDEMRLVRLFPATLSPDACFPHEYMPPNVYTTSFSASARDAGESRSFDYNEGGIQTIDLPVPWSYANDWREPRDVRHAVTANVQWSRDSMNILMRHTVTAEPHAGEQPRGFLDRDEPGSTPQDLGKATSAVEAASDIIEEAIVYLRPGNSITIQSDVLTPVVDGRASLSLNEQVEITWVERTHSPTDQDVVRLNCSASRSSGGQNWMVAWTKQIGGSIDPHEFVVDQLAYGGGGQLTVTYDDLVHVLGILERRRKIESELARRIDALNLTIEARMQLEDVTRRILHASQLNPDAHFSELGAAVPSALLDFLRGQYVADPALQECIRLRVVRRTVVNAKLDVWRSTDEGSQIHGIASCETSISID
jgi:hypothetical protein